MNSQSTSSLSIGLTKREQILLKELSNLKHKDHTNTQIILAQQMEINLLKDQLSFYQKSKQTSRQSSPLKITNKLSRLNHYTSLNGLESIQYDSFISIKRLCTNEISIHDLKQSWPHPSKSNSPFTLRKQQLNKDLTTRSKIVKLHLTNKPLKAKHISKKSITPKNEYLFDSQRNSLKESKYNIDQQESELMQTQDLGENICPSNFNCQYNQVNDKMEKFFCVRKSLTVQNTFLETLILVGGSQPKCLAYSKQPSDSILYSLPLFLYPIGTKPQTASRQFVIAMNIQQLQLAGGNYIFYQNQKGDQKTQINCICQSNASQKTVVYITKSQNFRQIFEQMKQFADDLSSQQLEKQLKLLQTLPKSINEPIEILSSLKQFIQSNTQQLALIILGILLENSILFIADEVSHLGNLIYSFLYLIV